MTLKEHAGICDLIYHPKTAAAIKQFTASYAEARAAISDEDRKAKYKQWGDPKVAQEICGAKLIKVMNDVLAHTFALSFLELNTLADDDFIEIINDHIDRNFTVTKLGQNGGAPKKQVVERRTNLLVLLERLATQEYEFPLYNLQVGKTDQLDKVTARLTYEMMLKLDRLAVDILDAQVKSSGLRATLNLHPSIVSGNIPDKNYYDMSGTDTAGKWSVEKLKLILDYVARFSADTSDDLGDMQVKSIFVASTQKRDFWDMCDLVATYDGASPNNVESNPQNLLPHEVRSEVWRSGKLEQMFGYKFAIVTRNIIASPYGYISTNRPMGYYWHKPSQDAVRLNNSAEMEKVNKNSMWMAQTMQMTAISEWTKNFLKVKV